MNAPTRRLAAVWFADIVGFTALASRDEGAAFRLVKLFEELVRAEVERHGGTVVKFIGDGALAWFNGTSAAVDAALALRALFQERTETEGNPALLRIGVHMGDIIVSPGGDVYGDGVNIASRLQGQAEPGRVVVSQDVWRQCRQRAEYRIVPLGLWELKGLSEPVWVYEVAPAEGGEKPVAEAPGTRAGRSRLQNVRAVAVLPFENLSGTDEAEALAAGLHNDLLTELSKVSELTVISRTSVRGYRGSDKSVPRIARELNVGTVVEGTLQSAGNRVRLNVQLIDGRRDVHRWADSYDRQLSRDNLFEMQSELTKRIVESLHAHLTSEEKARIDERPTGDLEAYRLCAQARAQLDRRTDAGMRRALELFERATVQDPGYAPAWVGVAESHGLLQNYGYADKEWALPRAEAAARHALELDPDSAEALASLAMLDLSGQDGPAAIRGLRQTVKLRPGYADVHNWLSWVHLLLGNPRPALESATRAVELNPLSPEAVSNLSLSYLATGEKEKALAEARRTLELDPSWGTARFYEGLALYHSARFEAAQAVLEDLVEPWAGAGPLATLALARAASGDVAGARERIGELEAAGDPFAVGLVLAALGETNAAFDAFRAAEPVAAWPALAVHHYYGEVWAPLRSDPRYDQLVQMVERSWGVQPD
ncbi:MAG: adenylate/guanylate cyclase domain-containing protein [Longimicrobiaceae bacterium]